MGMAACCLQAGVKEQRAAELTPERARVILASGDDTIKRRAAFRLLLAEATAEAAAKQYAGDRDPLIRRAALYFWLERGGDAALAYLKTAIADKDVAVRTLALQGLARYANLAEVRTILEKVEKSDPEAGLRRQAAALNWPFQRETRLLRDDPSWDYEILSVKKIQLPDSMWKFTIDPAGDGHRKDFFAADFNDNGWKPIKTGHWETQGWADYDGIAWYRMRFTMPEKIDSNAVEMLFEGVDEGAWVWLNGVYLGQHDIGPAGWNQMFRLDATKEIKWGTENILTVRVLDTMSNGGIWKPVYVEVLK
jgi:hypothetical protein